MLPSFHGEAVAADAAMMAEVCRREVERWPIGEPFELWPRMQAITQRVVMRAVFGPDEPTPPAGPRRQADGADRVAEHAAQPDQAGALRARSAGPQPRLPRGDGAGRGRRWWRRRSAAARERDAARRASPRCWPGRATRTARLLSERELRDELLTLLTDGPTSTSLAWTFERLMRNPEKLERARGEVLGGGDGAYVDAVIKETLRMRPPVPVVVRRLLAPLELGWGELPAGTVGRALHPADPRPRGLLPRAATASCPSASSAASPPTYAWIPFGGGVRRCLAASYAEMEMKRVLRTVLAMVDLRPADGARRGDAQKRDLLQPRPQRPGDRRAPRRRPSPRLDPGGGLRRRR